MSKLDDLVKELIDKGEWHNNEEVNAYVHGVIDCWNRLNKGGE